MFSPYLVVANWKMHKTNEETKEFINMFLEKKSQAQVDVVIAPPFTSLALAAQLLEGSLVNLGAQNMHQEKKGAFTGEISASMLVSNGVSYVILGHSERRSIFNETSDLVAKKVFQSLESGLKPIVCFGETLEQRESGDTKKIVQQQIEESLRDVSSSQMKNIVLAYEPVWAIGTGKTATPQMAQEVHSFCRKIMENKWGDEVSSLVPILYGGSVKPENTHDLMSQPDINGALVGGASLEAGSFAEIIKECSNTKVNK
jgi:triosephosphate isomerase (TIM)